MRIAVFKPSLYLFRRFNRKADSEKKHFLFVTEFTLGNERLFARAIHKKGGGPVQQCHDFNYRFPNKVAIIAMDN